MTFAYSIIGSQTVFGRGITGLAGVCPALMQFCARFLVWEAPGVWSEASLIFQEKEQ